MTNDQTVLDILLAKDADGSMPPSETMERFVANALLKDKDLDLDELESGLVDNGRDGGIDLIYTFVNGQLLQQDVPAPTISENVKIELVIIQAKTTAGWDEDAVHKLNTHLPILLDLGSTTEALERQFNKDVVQAIGLFRDNYISLVHHYPELAIRVFFATKGDKPHPNVVALKTSLTASLLAKFSSAAIEIGFPGASELLVLARRSPKTSFTIELAENPISTRGQGYICLVDLRTYSNFLKDEAGKIRLDLFESNIRAYQGKHKPVNNEIQDSLRKQNLEDFWWLNNGVTIIAAKVNLSAKAITVESPQIVNGLQTSQEIFNYFDGNDVEDDRRVLVRVLLSEDAEATARIIKATNSQTAIPSGSLRATDSIQRKIEEFLIPKGLFYDRRRNFYKNAGKPPSRIVTIKFAAQAVHSILSQRPDEARSKPSELLNEKKTYEELFSDKIPVNLYFNCISVLRMVDAQLRKSEEIELRIRQYLRLHVAMVLVARQVGVPSPNKNQISAMSPDSLSDKAIDEAFQFVKSKFEVLGGADRVAKSRPLTDALVGALKDELVNQRLAPGQT